MAGRSETPPLKPQAAALDAELAGCAGNGVNCVRGGAVGLSAESSRPIDRSDPAFLYRSRAESAATPEEAEKWLARAAAVDAVLAVDGPALAPGLQMSPEEDIDSRAPLEFMRAPTFVDDGAPLSFTGHGAYFLNPTAEAPLNLSLEREKRTGLAKCRTVRGVLEQALRDLDDPDSRVSKATRCLVIYANVDEEGAGDVGYYAAAQNGFEVIGILAEAVVMASEPE